MAPKPPTTAFIALILSTIFLIYFYYSLLSQPRPESHPGLLSPHCNLFVGKWEFDPDRKPVYDDTCPFHRNGWNCIRNKRERMGFINSWKWVPENCSLGRVDPVGFLGMMRGRKIGFVGDSLNENFLVSFLCVLRSGDRGAKKWKRMGAWRGAYFPGFNVTVGYHRAVLLAKYQLQPNHPNEDGIKEINRVDVDTPADEWAKITKFYDVLVFNTGHWWGPDKFPKETPLVFYQGGQPIVPTLDFKDGLRLVLKRMISYIEKEVPSTTVKFWRLQSPRHFSGGDWNQNGSCLFNEPLNESQLDVWFDPSNNGVNKEEREFNEVIKKALRGSSFQTLDLTHLSEYRADAHPAIWLGRKGAVADWGQDCMHWCLPGVPDTWVDILSQLIHHNYQRGNNDRRN